MRAFIVIGTCFGDECKGSVVDWLTREQGGSLVVRFNGGAQVAHHVVTPEGVEHTFNQFGAGTLAGADTYLSQHVLVNPQVLATEAVALLNLGIESPFKRIAIHHDAPVTTRYHVALNRLREMSRAEDRHGSCGMGIAETMVDYLAGQHIRFGELVDSDLRVRLLEIARAKLAIAIDLPRPLDVFPTWEEEMCVLNEAEKAVDILVNTYRIVANAVNIVDRIPEAEIAIFEGAQGVLLDQRWGFAPYHTWSDTTSSNARRIAQEAGYETTVLGVTRAYLTRHGRGPFPTEVGVAFESTNPENLWQEQLRYGWHDLALLRYATQAEKHLDGLIVTCLDQLLPECYYSDSYEVPEPSENQTLLMGQVAVNLESCDREEIPYLLARTTNTPLYATSHGPTASDKRVLGSVIL